MAQARAIARTDADSINAALLGVTASARGFRWRDRLDPRGHATASAISQRHTLPDVLGRVLAGRGIALDGVETMLNPTLKALMPDPDTLRDMPRASARLAKAIQAKERVAIFGDYDVDGASSSALLYRFLRHHGVEACIYIPDRLFEGYGPNVAAIEGLVRDGAKLIVTVDCGTTSFDPLAAAKRLGADVVVIDHHQADETLPAVDAIVNPNRQDDVSGLGVLCAAGVTFMVLVATARVLRQAGYYKTNGPEPDLLAELDIVALATVADVVPLTGLNRAFVTRGLQVMHQRQNVGLRALGDAAGLNQAPTPYHLGFILGPRINAGGRIGDAALGARLLATEDDMEAAKIAATLDRLNKERKTIETKMLEDAIGAAEAALLGGDDAPVILLGSEDYHKGIVGLVASRLTERFRKPSCVIAWDKAAANGVMHGTGSLRSVAGVDIGQAVRGAVASGLLTKGGGHAMAAGLTVEYAKLGDLAAYFGRVFSNRAAIASTAELEFDGTISAGGATAELIALLERVGPYGQGNPQPRFALAAHRIKFAKVVGETHVRCLLEGPDGSRLDAVAFRAANQPLGDMLLSNGGTALHLAGSLKRDTWGGREKIEFHIEDAARA